MNKRRIYFKLLFIFMFISRSFSISDFDALKNSNLLISSLSAFNLIVYLISSNFSGEHACASSYFFSSLTARSSFNAP